MKKVLSVFGTRPEAIKMAPVVKELESRDEIKSIVCVTAQHRDMLDQVIEIFKIKPDYDLDIMKSGQTLSYITAEVLKGIEEVIIKEKPDLVFNRLRSVMLKLVFGHMINIRRFRRK